MQLWIARDKAGDLFPEVKWEDAEPTEVELKIVKGNEKNRD